MGDQRSFSEGLASGSALLIQHRTLTVVIQELESAVAEHQAGGSESDCRQLVSAKLHGLICQLGAHFLAERQSVERDFDDAPHLKKQLLDLDQEHPRILAAFQEVQRHLEDQASNEQVCSLLAHAILDFRQHEALEDQLFASD